MSIVEHRSKTNGGSAPIGRRSTDDDSPAPQRKCDEDDEKVEGSHVETPLQMSAVNLTIGESDFDVRSLFTTKNMRGGIPEGCEEAGA